MMQYSSPVRDRVASHILVAVTLDTHIAPSPMASRAKVQTTQLGLLIATNHSVNAI